MISLVIVVEANPDKWELFAQFLKEEAADAVADEPGCRQFLVSQSNEKPNIFTLAEFYDDTAALDAHRKTPHFILFQERVKEHDLIVRKIESVTGKVVFPE